MVDKESAYEMLKSKVEHQAQQIEAEKNAILLEKEKRSQELEELKLQRERARTEREIQRAKEKNASQVTKMAKSFLGTMSSSIGREIARGVFGSLLRR